MPFVVTGDTSNGMLRICDYETGLLTREEIISPRGIYSTSAVGNLLAVALADDHVRLYDINTLTLLNEWSSTHTCAVSISHDGAVVAFGSTGQTFLICSTTTYETLHSIPCDDDWVYAINYSPCSEFVVFAIGGNHGDVAIVNVNTGDQVMRIACNDVQAIAYIDSERLATGSNASEVRIWHVTSGQCLATIAMGGGDGDIWAVSVSSDGKLVAAGADTGDTKIWDIESLECIYEHHTEHEVKAVCFGEGSDLIVAESSGITYSVDAFTKERIRTYQSNDGEVYALSINLDRSRCPSYWCMP